LQSWLQSARLQIRTTASDELADLKKQTATLQQLLELKTSTATVSDVTKGQSAFSKFLTACDKHIERPYLKKSKPAPPVNPVRSIKGDTINRRPRKKRGISGSS
jgi:hypothetical protein